MPQGYERIATPFARRLVNDARVLRDLSPADRELRGVDHPAFALEDPGHGLLVAPIDVERLRNPHAVLRLDGCGLPDQLRQERANDLVFRREVDLWPRAGDRDEAYAVGRPQRRDEPGDAVHREPSAAQPDVAL